MPNYDTQTAPSVGRANSQAPKSVTISEIVGETDKYTSELLSDVRSIADAVCGSNGESSGSCPQPTGLLYNLQAHRSLIGEIGLEVYRIKQALGL
jgi:hypothetical protein